MAYGRGVHGIPDRLGGSTGRRQRRAPLLCDHRRRFQERAAAASPIRDHRAASCAACGRHDVPGRLWAAAPGIASAADVRAVRPPRMARHSRRDDRRCSGERTRPDGAANRRRGGRSGRSMVVRRHELGHRGEMGSGWWRSAGAGGGVALRGRRSGWVAPSCGVAHCGFIWHRWSCVGEPLRGRDSSASGVGDHDRVGGSGRGVRAAVPASRHERAHAPLPLSCPRAARASAVPGGVRPGCARAGGEPAWRHFGRRERDRHRGDDGSGDGAAICVRHADQQRPRVRLGARSRRVASRARP